MLYFLIAALICGADRLSKLWVVRNIPLSGSRMLIPGVLELTHVRNTGMAFSMLSEHTWLLALVSAVVAAGIAVILVKGKFTRWEKVFLAFILGGALGNFIDRAFLGYVVDMINPVFMNFAVFNLADSFIDVGAVMFCVLYIVRSVREEREAKAKKQTPEVPHDGDADGN